MNERIKQIAEKCGLYIAYDNRDVTDRELEHFAELIVRECAALNKRQGYELSGVVADVEDSHDGFDQVCLNTVIRVETYLCGNALEEHFGVDSTE